MTESHPILAHLALFRELLTLKKLRRTGWQLRGIRDGESLADHGFGVAILTLLLADQVTPPPDRERAVLLALVHELGEIRIGDIPFPALPYYPEKSAMEQRAVADILAGLGQKTRDELVNAFREFEVGETREARFVRAIDKLDMLLTAAEYERAGFSGLEDFWKNPSTFALIGHFPELAAIAQHLRETRTSRLSGTMASGLDM